MTMKSKFALVIAAVALLCLVTWNSKAERPSRSDWEYKTYTVWGMADLPPTNLKQLNELGDDGWEMVTVITENATRAGIPQTKRTYYFKRPV